MWLLEMTFKEWLNEIEIFGSRLERLRQDFPEVNLNILIQWLEAAYRVGYYEGRNDGN